MGPLIIHSVLAIVGIRLGLYCVMAWQRLRLKHGRRRDAGRRAGSASSWSRCRSSRC